MISSIAIDDEPLALEKIKGFVEKIPNLSLLDTFISGITAIDFLKSHSIDLIFLDIEMKDLTGIQFIESMDLHSKIIVTTAFEKYALKGFELQVCDYLLKPISFERFLKACNKAFTEIKRLPNNAIHQKIFVKTEYRLEGVFTSEISYIKGMGDYRMIVTGNKKIMTLQTFNDLSDMLPYDKFCRVHNSFIVSMDKIEKIERNRIKIGDQLIPISNTYMNDFYSKICP